MQNLINQSSRSENKGGQVRFGRQFSGGIMSQTYNEIELTVAVAAAAYVIDSIQQQSNISKKDKRGEANDPIRSSSRRKETKPISIPQSKKSSGRNSVASSGNADMKQKAPVTTKVPGKATDSAPSVRRTITFPEEQLERSNSFIYRTPSKPDLPSMKPASPEITPLKDVIKNQTSATRFDGPPPQMQKPNIPAAQMADIRASKPDQPQIEKHGTETIITRNSSGRVTDADTWERMEMAKIRER